MAKVSKNDLLGSTSAIRPVSAMSVTGKKGGEQIIAIEDDFLISAEVRDGKFVVTNIAHPSAPANPAPAFKKA